MIEFHDYDPSHPFDVSEKHIIANRKITLNYAPLKGSVSIDGLSEDTTGTVPQGTFYINYGEADNYHSADQVVHFPEGYDGAAVTVEYKGVSTLLRAEHMNEIKNFIERGASELAARIIAEHEQVMTDKWNELFEIHCQHITSALDSIREAIAALGGEGGGSIDESQIAEDDEADAMLDEYFPGDVEPTAKSVEIASNEEADMMLDEFFPTPDTEPDETGDTTGIEEVATDEEFQAMLDEELPDIGDL